MKKKNATTSFPPNIHDIWITAEEDNGFAKTTALLVSLSVIVLLATYWFIRPTVPVDDGVMVACTGEAKSCSDGSSVGRAGQNCEFAACPGEEGMERESMDTSDWKAYRNEKHGFEVRYPGDWEFGYDNPSALIRDDFIHINSVIDSAQRISFQATPGIYNDIFFYFSDESGCYIFERNKFRLDICDASKVAEYGNYELVDPQIIKAIAQTIIFN